MKIKDIKVWSVDLGNTKPYTIAFKTIDEVKNAFVEIILENGLTGIGAGNPSEYVVGETLDQCLDALKQKNLQFLIGRDIREFNQLTFRGLAKISRQSLRTGCVGHCVARRVHKISGYSAGEISWTKN